MRKFIVLTVLLNLLALRAIAEDAKTNSVPKTEPPAKIMAAEAKKHVGKNATVTGIVAEVNKAEKLVRLNFENAYPNQTFTAVIFSSNTNQFPEVEKLKGKTVEVTGKIGEFRDRPQIILSNTNQLKVVEKKSE